MDQEIHGDLNGRALCGADAPAGLAGQRLTCDACREIQQGLRPWPVRNTKTTEELVVLREAHK